MTEATSTNPHIMDTSRFHSQVQRLMICSGMIYSMIQVSILAFAVLFLLPLLGSANVTFELRLEDFANHTHLFKLIAYLMGLPSLFFFLFLGGVYYYLHTIPERVKGILIASLVSGTVQTIILPFSVIVCLVGVDIAAAGGDKITGGAFESIVTYAFGLSAIPQTIFLLTLSVLLVDRKWLSRFGFFIAVYGFAGTLTIVNRDFFLMSLSGGVLVHIWIFWCSFELYLYQEDSTTEFQFKGGMANILHNL